MSAAHGGGGTPALSSVAPADEFQFDPGTDSVTALPPPTALAPLSVRVRCLADGRAALAVGRDLGRPVLLVSDPAAAGFAGVGWWAALVRLLADEAGDQPFTALLDCGDAPGHVLAALRAGVTDIAFHGGEEVAAKLSDIAGQMGARLHPPHEGTVIDLRGARDRAARLHQIAAETIRSG